MTSLRADHWRALKDRPSVDVLIIGAGINGAGLFRELAAQGIDCVIIDKQDFGAGTSAAPSRLIHGGIKYLETGEFGLVAQSTLERNLLLRNAPHYVRPLPVTVPIFSWFGGMISVLGSFLRLGAPPANRGAVIIALGLWLYDFYGSRFRAMPRHHMSGKARSLSEIPALTPDIVATGTYYDAWISHPERLVLELIGDGMAIHQGASAFNRVTPIGLVDGGIAILDQETQDRQVIRPRIVVNASGPWIDHVNKLLGAPTDFIGGTKGSHLLLDHDELLAQLDGRMIYYEASDGRICLVYPYLGRALVGSTDIPADDLDDALCEESEVDYLLNSLAMLFPTLKFSREQIVYRYCGVRPLPRSDAHNPGLISRDHSLPAAEPENGRPFPILSLVGGKWTTFRGFAEEAADEVLKRVEQTRKRDTLGLPIGGGSDYPMNDASRAEWITRESQRTGLASERIAVLLERYGTRASLIADHCANSQDRSLEHAPSYSEREVDFLAGAEHVLHLDDIIFRRTLLAVLGQVTLPLLNEIATIAGAALGWSEDRRQAEINQSRTELEHIHGVRLA